MLEVKCPECGSIHVAINYRPLCGSASEGIIIYWAICNEVECRAQFHLKFVLKDPQIIPLSEDRYVHFAADGNHIVEEATDDELQTD